MIELVEKKCKIPEMIYTQQNIFFIAALIN